MTDGRYVYCITEAGVGKAVTGVGLSGGSVFTVAHKDIAAVVSPVPFKEIESNLQNILTHQKVVELSRSAGTTLPVRFGIIFKSEAGVKELLTKSYEDYQTKISKLGGKVEYGIKVILNPVGLKRIREEIEKESPEVKKTKKAVARSGRGGAYLLSIKKEEAIKAELYRRTGTISRSINEKIAKAASANSMLKTEHDQIILNAAYLVDQAEVQDFKEKVEKVKKEFERDGLIIHMSGPWAPYSFC